MRIIKILFYILGWILIFSAFLLVVFGIFYGITETRNFYNRQDEYSSHDTEREEYINLLDSLQLRAEMLQETDSTTANYIKQQIDSIQSCEEYSELFGTPAPPVGFSLAGLVSVFAFVIALVPLTIGILLVIFIKIKQQ